MRCERVRESLVALMDGELTGFTAWRIRQHAARCAICSSELVSLRALNDQVRSLDILSRDSTAVGKLPGVTVPEAISNRRRPDFMPGGWQARPHGGPGWMAGGFLPAAAILGALTLIAFGVTRWTSALTTGRRPALL